MGPQTIISEDGCVFTEEFGISGMHWGSTVVGRLCSSGTMGSQLQTHLECPSDAPACK